MPDPEEKRKYVRFQVPGATVSYELNGFLQQAFREICPVLNLSKCGLGFQTTRQLKPGQNLTVTLNSNKAPIQLQTQVIYCVPHTETNEAYRVGVVRAPFSAGTWRNSPEAFDVLNQLENEYAK